MQPTLSKPSASAYLEQLIVGHPEAAASRTFGAAATQQIKAELRRCGAKGLAWLDSLHAQGWNGILADEMGLGKTCQVCLPPSNPVQPTEPHCCISTNLAQALPLNPNTPGVLTSRPMA